VALLLRSKAIPIGLLDAQADGCSLLVSHIHLDHEADGIGLIS
jgi:hypothetical protein